MIFKTRISRLFLCPAILKTNYKYPITGRKGVKIYAVYRTGIHAESETDGLVDVPKNYEPFEFVHYTGNTYTTKIHDSLKISNRKWMWWSCGIGGGSVLYYLIKVRDYTFMEAVQKKLFLPSMESDIKLWYVTVEYLDVLLERTSKLCVSIGNC